MAIGDNELRLPPLGIYSPNELGGAVVVDGTWSTDGDDDAIIGRGGCFAALLLDPVAPLVVSANCCCLGVTTGGSSATL